MIQFDLLKFDQDNNLIIQVSIPDKDYFKNVSLSGIYIDTHKSYSSGGPSSTPIYKYKINFADISNGSLNNSIVSIDKVENNLVKSMKLIIPSTSIPCSIKGTIFFIWATTVGVPSPNTPCGQDIPQKVQWIITTPQIYEKFIPLLKSINCDCSNTKDFADTFLKYKAFQYSMNSEDYTEGINIWNKFFSKDKAVTIKKGCGCHGNII